MPKKPKQPTPKKGSSFMGWAVYPPSDLIFDIFRLKRDAKQNSEMKNNLYNIHYIVKVKCTVL